MHQDASAALAPLPPGERPLSLRRLSAIVILGAVALVGIQLTPKEVFGDNARKFLATEVCSLLIGLALCAWLVIDSGLSRRVRRRISIAYVLIALALVAVFRLDWKGDMEQIAKPRRWVLNVARAIGVDVGDVAPEARTASVALKLEPGEFDSYSFLGPTHDGKFKPAGGKPARDWAARPPKLLWRVPVGDGWSSFVVVGDYVYTQQQTTDEAFEQVVCLNIRDGKLEWVHSDAPGHNWFLGGHGPRATPAYHDGKLYALGSAGLLNCLDAATGKVLWSRDVVAENNAENPMWGKSSSPLVVKSKSRGDLVVISVGGKAGRSLVAYSAADGKPVWHGGDDPSGYASPVELTLAGLRQIVIVNFQSVVGHDPETGGVLWSYDRWSSNDPKVPQPIAIDDKRLFISAGYGVGCRMLEITKSGDAWKVDELWKSTKFKPKFMNPIVRDGYAYGLDDGEFLMCVDLNDKAEVKWRSKRGMNYGHGQILLVDDLLIVQSQEGDLALVPARPDKFEELSRITALPEGISWNQPVLVGNKLLVRNDEEAACYELPTE